MQLMSDLSHPLSAAALGTLDFSLLYDQENNALHCTISKAKVGARAPTVPRPRVLGEGMRSEGQFSPSISCPGVVSVLCGCRAGRGFLPQSSQLPQNVCRGRYLGKEQHKEGGGKREDEGLGGAFKGQEAPRAGEGLLREERAGRPRCPTLDAETTPGRVPLLDSGPETCSQSGCGRPCPSGWHASALCSAMFPSSPHTSLPPGGRCQSRCSPRR